MARRGRMRIVWRAFILLLAAGFACGAYIYLTLPDVRVHAQNPKTTTFIELRSQQAVAKGEPMRRVQRWVSYPRISSNLKRAVSSPRTARSGSTKAWTSRRSRSRWRPTSSAWSGRGARVQITQQLAKNLYLSPSKNPIRKMQEMLIARRLEAELTKQRILELYLNVVEWGNGIYGAEAAARSYFGKPAADLNPSEAALLAGALVNARLLDPGHPTPRLRRRQEMVLRQMAASRRRRP